MEIMDGANSMPWYPLGEHQGIKIEISDIAPRDKFKYSYDLWSNGLSADAFTISRTYKVTVRSRTMGDGLWTFNLDSKGRVVNISYTGTYWNAVRIPMPVQQIDNVYLHYPEYKPEMHRLIGGTWIKGKWMDSFDRRNLTYRLEIVQDGDVFFDIAMGAWDTVTDVLTGLTPDDVPEGSRDMLQRLRALRPCSSKELEKEMDNFHLILQQSTEKLPVEPPELALEHYHAIPVIVEDGCGGACTYCSLYDRRIHPRTKENVFNQVDAILDYLGEEHDHYALVVLLDGDALTVPTELLLEEIRYMREKFEIDAAEFVHVFSKASTVNRLSKEDLLKLKAAGLKNVNMGLESGCDELLSLVKPGQTTDDFALAVNKLNDCGIDISINIIAGLGGRRYAEAHVRDTVSFLKTLPVGIKVFFSPISVSEKSRYYRQQLDFEPMTLEEIDHQCDLFMNSYPCSEYLFVPI